MIAYQSDLDSITLSCGVVEKPFGQIRLHCLELLTISADFAQFECGNVLGQIPTRFWDYLLQMAFLHSNNNIFLCHFRRLIHLTMIFRRRNLKRLAMDMFIEWYVATPSKAALHGYVMEADEEDDTNFMFDLKKMPPNLHFENLSKTSSRSCTSSARLYTHTCFNVFIYQLLFLDVRLSHSRYCVATEPLFREKV